MFKMYISTLMMMIIINPPPPPHTHTAAHKEWWKWNKMFVFRLGTLRWSRPDCTDSLPWRLYTACMVPSFFSWVYFIFTFEFLSADSSQWPPGLAARVEEILIFHPSLGGGGRWRNVESMFLKDLSPVDLLTALHTKLSSNVGPYWISELRLPPLHSEGRSVMARTASVGPSSVLSLWVGEEKQVVAPLQLWNFDV